MHNCIYFDNNATTQLSQNALNAMLPFLKESYGNASSKLHPFGWEAQVAVDKARLQLANLLACAHDELIFTSGATEACNLAIKGVAEAYKQKGNHIISVKTEHSAVLESLNVLSKNGYEITLLSVKPDGLIDIDELILAIKKTTILISIMAANNETGVLQPLEQIAQIANEKNIVFFTDATQAIGKERFSVKELGISIAAMSAHKFHGPKGIGALFLSKHKPAVSILPQMHGGKQENSIRAGTLNVPAIVGFGAAAQEALENYWDNAAIVGKLRNFFEHQLLDIEGIKINGSTRFRLANTSNIHFPENVSLKHLYAKFAFSSGSACSSGLTQTSHVLMAMGMSKEEIKNSFRFSFSKYNTIEEVKKLTESLLKKQLS
ncbi:MAG: cysteine desulfurase [Bacteroidetes bacterium]|nr:cysteine desulfurase [Bacteroidota bacterium]